MSQIEPQIISGGRIEGGAVVIELNRIKLILTRSFQVGASRAVLSLVEAMPKEALRAHLPDLYEGAHAARHFRVFRVESARAAHPQTTAAAQL